MKQPSWKRLPKNATFHIHCLLNLAAFFVFAEHAAAWHKLPAGASGWSSSGRQAIRGMTLGPIECPEQPSCGYGSPASAIVLDELVRKGVNWIAVTPFGRVWDLGSTTIKHSLESSFEESHRDILEITRQAHARGLSVMMIPHIFVEASGSDGDAPDKWRGEFDMASQSRWERYQRSYTEFVLAWARVAQAAHIDAFSIGAECTSWSGKFGDYWTGLIAQVRANYAGLLTYSANWYGEVYNVPFWDQLDLIGINAFFDLAQHENATYDEYVKSAQGYLQDVETLSQTLQMPVVLMELGYTSRKNAGVHPWKWPESLGQGQIDYAEQTRAFSALTEVFLRSEAIIGLFVWRYPANLDDIQEPIWGYTPYTKPADDFLSTVFQQRWAADPDPLFSKTRAPHWPAWSASGLPLP